MSSARGVTMANGEVCAVEYAYTWRECGATFIRMDLRYPDGKSTFIVCPFPVF